MENTYWVYILTNKYNTVFYTGVTNNINRRMYEHKNNLIKGFSSKYKTHKLVFAENTNSIYDAIAFEKIIKGYSRKKKLALIMKTNPTLIDLYSLPFPNL